MHQWGNGPLARGGIHLATLGCFQQQQFQGGTGQRSRAGPGPLTRGLLASQPETLAIIGQNPGRCYGDRLLQACHFFPGRNVRALHNSGGARDHQPGSHVAADPPLAFASRLSFHRPRSSGTCLCPGEPLPGMAKATSPARTDRLPELSVTLGWEEWRRRCAFA